MSRLRRFLIFALALSAPTLALVVPAQSASAEGGPVTQVAVWGDSMTMVWPVFLEDLLGVPVLRFGEGSTDVQQTQVKFEKWVRENPGQVATTGHLCWCGHVNVNGEHDGKSIDERSIVPTLLEMADLVPDGLFMPIGLSNGRDAPQGSDPYDQLINSPAYPNVQSGTAVNEDMYEAFQGAYAEVRRYLVTDGLRVAGLQETPADRANTDVDVPPAQLLRGKNIHDAHLSDAGKQVTAIRLDELIRAAGWIAGAPGPDKLATATSLTTSPTSPTPRGTAIRASALVTNMSGQPGTPTGTVQFYKDGVAFGTAIMLNTQGRATSPLVKMPPGTHVITAGYSGSTTYNPSNAPAINHTVDP